VPLANGELVMYAVGTDGNIWGSGQTSQYGSWTTWMQMTSTGGFTGRPAVIQGANGNIGIYAATTTGQLEGASQTSPGSAFSPYTNVGGTNVNLTGDPDLLRTNSGALVIYAPGTANTIWGTGQTSQYGPWTTWLQV
jgi:hypothetical protein